MYYYILKDLFLIKMKSTTILKRRFSTEDVETSKKRIMTDQ